MNIHLIRIKVDLYEVWISGIIYCLLFYFKTILTPFFPARFMVYLSLEERSSESIGHKDLRRNMTRQYMNGGGDSFLLMDTIRHARILLLFF